MTVNSRSCTRSKVVKRAAQFGQNRRRRIAPRSSVGRESFTWVSSAPQNGQRISSLPLVDLRLSVPLVLWAFLTVDRKAGAEGADLVAYSRFGGAVVGRPLGERSQHLDDVSPDRAELVRPESARRRRRRAEPDSRGHRRPLRIERNTVLVAGDAGAFETALGVPAGDPERPQIDQHQMRVGPARDDLKT